MTEWQKPEWGMGNSAFFFISGTQFPDFRQFNEIAHVDKIARITHFLTVIVFF